MTKYHRPTKSAAYHEAGHAVAMCVLHVAFRSVTIIPNDTLASDGHVTLAKWRGNPPTVEKSERMLWRVSRRILCLFAGAEAEREFFDRLDSYRAKTDREYALLHAIQVTSDGDEAALLFMWLQARAKAFVRQLGMIRAIHAVATELVEKKELSNTRVREIVRSAMANKLAGTRPRKKKGKVKL